MSLAIDLLNPIIFRTKG